VSRAALLLLLVGCDVGTARRRDTLRGHDDTVRVVSDSATSKDYVARVLESQLGQTPRMGWFVPPDRFYGPGRHQTAFVLSAAPIIERFPFVTQVDGATRAAISKQHGVACDAADTLSEYSGRAVAEASRALYVGRAFGGRVTVGAWRVTLSDSALAKARAFLMAGRAPAAFFRDTAVGVAPQLPVFSFHTAYDSSGTLVRAGMFLHDRDGRILGREVETVSEETVCADCAVPSFQDAIGIAHRYRVLNAFELPGFRYPVLLLDTSTLEGRALSLVSFSPVGVASEFRIYEYVVNCPGAD
jgi:hypothetical protein